MWQDYPVIYVWYGVVESEGKEPMLMYNRCVCETQARWTHKYAPPMLTRHHNRYMFTLS